MATVTLATLETRARERADMVGSSFVSQAELQQLLTASAQKLHGLLAQKFGDDYLFSTYNVSTTAGTSSYAMPSDFFKLLAVELDINGRPQDLKPFMLKERNHHRNNVFDTVLRLPRYRLMGNNLVIYPAPSDARTLTVYYVPELTLAAGLIPAAGVTFPNGWEELIILDAARKMLMKEESDVREITAEVQNLVAEIEAAAADRDAGAPQQAVDVEAQESDPLVDFW